MSVVIDHPRRTAPAGIADDLRRFASDPELKVADREALREAIGALERLVGLDDVKKLIYTLIAQRLVNERRRAYGLKTERQTVHMIFRGNPGTGKTTVARLLGRIFRELGVLSRGHLIEVERADLVGEYIGHTAQKTRELIRRAVGGILFIDEAYSLIRGGEKDFGREAIDTLVKGMEDHRDDLIVILAGYDREMLAFLQANPGLPSRFPLQIVFPDYRMEELLKIAEAMCAEREYRMDAGARRRLEERIARAMLRRDVPFANARFVRNAVERAIRRHAVRTVRQGTTSREALMTLTADDFADDGDGL
ncbi:AAA family ATPase [Hydrogenibacillus sp. N12]|nr:AAA family ATPase [Hydrogenibacillus sp. N12]